METDEQRFAEFVKEHEATIYMVCYMFAKNKDDAADLFQEVLINLWTGFNTFDGSNERAWVYRVAMNTCISIDRKKKAQKHDSLDFIAELPADNELYTEQVKMLYERISLLHPLDRAVVLLWLENISYEEIGDIIGITPQNVGVRLMRIREKLRNMQ